jgi:hypothetical protein
MATQTATQTMASLPGTQEVMPVVSDMLFEN